jgi:arylsulfatase A-like enzyme
MTTDRPNILLVVADQLRWDWLSCTSTPGPDTPALDALAARGVRFTTCTTTSAMCAPARISLATGLLPHRLGALTNDVYLPARAPTWYQRLRDADYRVGLVGKADLAKPQRHNGLRGDRPSAFRWGFTHPLEVEGKLHAGTSPIPIGPYTTWLAEHGLLDPLHADYLARMAHLYVERRGDGLYRDSVLPDHAFADIWIGDQAVRWIEQTTDDFPWFLQIGFAGPHDPYDPPSSWADRYRDRVVADPVPAPPEVPRRVERLRFDCSAEEVRVARRQHTASLAIIDEQVRRILDATGQAEHTVVVFTSDHGDMLGDHGLFQKHVAYEAAMRVPLIVAGPGIAQGSVTDSLVELPDVGETILELAGITPTPDVDARSFTPLLAIPSAPHRADAVCIEDTYVALRTATHKLITTHSDGDELYDLGNDPRELCNLADHRSDLVQTLRKRLIARLREGSWSR